VVNRCGQSSPSGAPGLTRAQSWLLIFLGAASLCNGFDFIAITQLLPNIRADMGLSVSQGGQLIAFINLGAIAAYGLVGRADRVGRRRMLMLNLAGFALSSLASGLAPGILSLAVMQLLGRMFLIGSTAMAMVYAAEEFPAARRGLTLGIVQGFLSLGMILGAALTPWLLTASTGWRTVYLIGAVPVLLVPVGRRLVGETRRFQEAVEAPGAGSMTFRELWRSPYRPRLLIVGFLWFAAFWGTQSAVAFWKEFAVAERGFSDGQVGAAVAIASFLAMPLIFGVGRFLDRVGRRRGGAGILGFEALAILASYSLTGFLPLVAALVAGIFGAAAVQVVLNAYTTELFPTRCRGLAYAGAKVVIGRVGYVCSPLVTGALAASVGWSGAVSLTAIGPLLAMAALLAFLPETQGAELEETSAMPPCTP
jgi:putative MFS transporter